MGTGSLCGGLLAAVVTVVFQQRQILRARRPATVCSGSPRSLHCQYLPRFRLNIESEMGWARVLSGTEEVRSVPLPSFVVVGVI